MWKGIRRPRGNLGLVPGKYPGSLPWLRPRNVLRPRSSPPQFSTLPRSLPPAGGSSAWHAGPSPDCQRARLFRSPQVFAALFAWTAPSGCFYPSGQLLLFLPKVQLMSLPLQLLPWLSWSSCPSLTHGSDSVIAVHVLAGVSEGSSSPSTASWREGSSSPSTAATSPCLKVLPGMGRNLVSGY